MSEEKDLLSKYPEFKEVVVKQEFIGKENNMFELITNGRADISAEGYKRTQLIIFPDQLEEILDKHFVRLPVGAKVVNYLGKFFVSKEELDKNWIKKTDLNHKSIRKYFIEKQKVKDAILNALDVADSLGEHGLMDKYKRRILNILGLDEE